MVRRALINLLIAIMAVAGCKHHGGKGEHEDLFRFDPALGRCMHGESEGRNVGKIGECGKVQGVDLSGRDLSHKNLRGMHFDQVNLSKANLSSANLYYATFTGSNLKGASLRDATAIGYFSDTSMREADLRGAEFFQFVAESKKNIATFANVDFKAALINSRTVMDLDIGDAVFAKGMVYEGSDNPPKHIASVDAELSISGPNALTIPERLRLQQDFNSFKNFAVDAKPGWFSKVFGGSNMDFVYQYLSPRLNFFVSGNAEQTGGKSLVVAANYGPSFWASLYSQQSGSHTTLASKDVNGRLVSLDSPRRGMIYLGKQYNSLKVPQIRRLATLVHEARHSDCPVAPSADQLKNFFSSGERGGSTCNYSHAVCPAGHALEGLEACDTLPWGAYGVSAVFLDKIAKDCSSCSEEEKQLALIFSMETKSRVLVIEEMMSGKLGEPNMESIQ